MAEEKRKTEVSRRRFVQGGGFAAMAAGAVAGFGPGRATWAQAQTTAPATAPTSGQAAVASEYAFGDGIKRIKAAKKVVFAMPGSSVPPQYYHDPQTNQPTGYDVEIAKLIAKDLDVEPVFEEAVVAARIIGLQGGKYDIVLGGTANSPVRAMSVVFTRGYIPYQQVLLVKASSKVKAIEELNDAKYTITCQIGATAEFRARELFPKATIKPLQINEAMLDVASGRAEADLVELYIAGPFAKNHPTTRILGGLEKPVVTSTEYGCLVCRPTDMALRDWLDNWVYWYESRGRLPALYASIIGPAIRGESVKK
jgi:ABC-type amino acid transport substrate-binding protein